MCVCVHYKVFFHYQVPSRTLGLGSTKREEWKEIFKRDCTNVITLLVGLVCSAMCVVTTAISVFTPVINVVTHATSVTTPAVSAVTPAVSIVTSAISVATPAISVATPAISVATPAISVTTPTISVATPAISVATPVQCLCVDGHPDFQSCTNCQLLFLHLCLRLCHWSSVGRM